MTLENFGSSEYPGEFNMIVLPILSTLLLTLSANDPPTLQQGGGMRQQDEGSVQAIESAINSYLDVQANKSIVTPGDYNEWPLDLTAGQVVIADAESDAFDPAMEIVDAKGTVRSGNDDRYPGDQRPLLFWRCPADGKFGLRVRSFQGKSGGQSFTRFRIYDTFDIGSGATPTEKWVETSRRMLVRVPMKKGEIKQLVFEVPDGWYHYPQIGRAISPIGLPNTVLSRPLDRAISNTIMAPVDGDYYVVANVSIPQRRKLRGVTRDIVAGSLAASGSTLSATVPVNQPNLWLTTAKAGDFIEVTAPALSIGAQIVLSDEPEIAKFDLAKPETNPFFPKAPDAPADPGPSFVELPARARDSRIRVFAVRRDTKLWLASNGAGTNAKTYTINVKPAARAFTDAPGLGSKLRIGNTDYWSFDAKVGEVMTFDFGASGFAQKLVVRNPDLAEVLRADAMPDQAKIPWSMITSRPGRYLVAVSSLGDGGGGDYTVARKVYPPKEFGKGSPATGDFADGQTKVWKFNAKPDEPLYIHWKSSERSYRVSIRDAEGSPVSFNLTGIDGQNEYGILKVDRATTFLIVLTPGEKNATYSIQLSDLPGYKKN